MVEQENHKVEEKQETQQKTNTGEQRWRWNSRVGARERGKAGGKGEQEKENKQGERGEQEE